MAKNKITVGLEIDDKGDLKRIRKEAKGAAKSVDGLTNSKKRTGKAQNSYHRREKGVAGATSNSTKAFSKQAQTLEGSLVPAYAVLAANIFALTALFGVLQRSTGLEKLEQGLIFTGRAAGQNLPLIVDQLKEITGQAIRTGDAMKAVAIGTSAGFSSDQLKGLTTVAAGASKALGRDMTDAMDRLTRGAAKLEPEILDELGIMIRLDTVTQDYAASVGKMASELSQFERRMAFTNAIIDQGTRKFGAINDAVDSNPYDRLAATFSSITQDGLRVINKVLNPLVGLLASNPTMLIGVLAMFGTTIAKQMVPSLKQAAAAAAEQAQSAKVAEAANLKYLEAIEGGPAAFNRQVQAMAKGNLSSKKSKKAIDALRKSYEMHSKQLAGYNNQLDRENGKYERKQRIVNELRATLETLDNQQRLNKTSLRDSTVATATNTAANMRMGNMASSLRDIIKSLGQARILDIQLTNMQAASQTGLARTLTLVQGRFRRAAVAAKVFGTALLTAIPIIGQVVAVVTMVFAGLKSLYDKFRDKSLDEFRKKADNVNKVLEEIPNIVAQAEAAYDDLTDASSRYIKSMEPAAGILNQLATEASGIVVSFDISQAMIQQEQLARELKLSGIAELDLENTPFANQANLVRSIFSAFSNLNTEGKISDASEILEENLKNILTEGRATYSRLAKMAEDDSAEKLRFIEVRDQFASLMAAFDTSTPEKIQQQLQDLNIELNSSVQTFQAASEIAKKAQENFAGRYKLDGAFAKDVELLTSALITLGDESDKPIIQKYNEALAAYGMTVKDVNPFLEKMVSIERTKLGLLKEEANSDRNKILEKYVDTQEFSKQVLEDEISLLQTRLVLVTQVNQQQRALDNVAREKAIKAQKLAQQELENLRNMDTSGFDDKGRERHEARIEAAKTRVITAQLQINRLEQNNVKYMQDKNKLLNEEVAARLELLDISMNTRLTAEENYELSKDRLKMEGLLLNIENSRLARGPYESTTLALNSLKMELAVQETLLDIENERRATKLRNLKDDKRIAQQAAAAAETALQDPSVTGDDRKEALTQLEMANKRLMDIDLERLEITNEQKAALAKILQLTNSIKEETQNKHLESGGPGQAAMAFAASSTETLNKTAVNDDGSVNVGTAVGEIGKAFTPLAEQLKTLGPEGELMGQITQSALIMSESFVSAFEKIKEGGEGTKATMGKISAGLYAVGGAISQIAAIQQASSEARVAALDKEIAAEKARDGQSAQSTAKIAALEKKKEAEKRKAFEKNKKMRMAETVINTAAAIMQVMAQGGIFAIPIAAMVGAMGAMQLAIISSSSYQGAAGAGGAKGPSKISVGSRSNAVDFAKGTSPAGELAYARGEGGTGSGMTDYKPRGAFTGMKMRASGGNVGITVGEQGPEMFIPETPGRIVPAGQVAEGGGSSNVTFQINSMDTVDAMEIIKGNRGNIIGMLREVHNYYGESFMEEVNENALPPTGSKTRGSSLRK